MIQKFTTDNLLSKTKDNNITVLFIFLGEEL